MQITWLIHATWLRPHGAVMVWSRARLNSFPKTQKTFWLRPHPPAGRSDLQTLLLLLRLPSPLRGALLPRLVAIVLVVVVEDDLSLPPAQAGRVRGAVAALEAAQQALVVARDLADGLLDLFDALGAIELDQQVAVLAVDALLDQQAPVVVGAVVVVLCFAALGQPHDAGLALVRRDAAEQVQLDEAVELAGRQLVLAPQLVEQSDVEQVGGGHDARLGGGRRGVEGDLGKGVVGAEAAVVAVIAQVVKGFVGVLDRDFGHGAVGEEGPRDRVEQMAAVRVVLMGREYDKLRDAGA